MAEFRLKGDRLFICWRLITDPELALQGLKVTLPILSGTVPDQKQQRMHKHMQGGGKKSVCVHNRINKTRKRRARCAHGG